MTTRKFMSRKTKKYSREQSGGSLRVPRVPKSKVSIPNSVVMPKKNSRMRRLIMTRRADTTPEQAQGFLTRARQHAQNIAPAELQKYKTVFDEIKANPDVYGTGKRTKEQYDKMLRLANMKGIQQAAFAELYKRFGTTAASSTIEQILGKMKSKNSKAGYMDIDEIRTSLGVRKARTGLTAVNENVGYIDVATATSLAKQPLAPARDAGYMTVKEMQATLPNSSEYI